MAPNYNRYSATPEVTSLLTFGRAGSADFGNHEEVFKTLLISNGLQILFHNSECTVHRRIWSATLKYVPRGIGMAPPVWISPLSIHRPSMHCHLVCVCFLAQQMVNRLLYWRYNSCYVDWLNLLVIGTNNHHRGMGVLLLCRTCSVLCCTAILCILPR